MLGFGASYIRDLTVHGWYFAEFTMQSPPISFIVSQFAGIQTVFTVYHKKEHLTHKSQQVVHQAICLQKSLVQMHHSLVWNVYSSTHLEIRNIQSSDTWLLGVFDLSSCHVYLTTQLKLKPDRLCDIHIIYNTVKWQKITCQPCDGWK